MASNTPAPELSKSKSKKAKKQKVTNNILGNSWASSNTPEIPSLYLKNSLTSPKINNTDETQPHSPVPKAQTPGLNLGNLFFNPAASAALDNMAPIEKEPERPSTPDSPPLLLSTYASENRLYEGAELPRTYTVAEFVNTINKYKIKLPVEAPISAEEACVPGFEQTLEPSVSRGSEPPTSEMDKKLRALRLAQSSGSGSSFSRSDRLGSVTEETDTTSPGMIQHPSAGSTFKDLYYGSGGTGATPPGGVGSIAPGTSHHSSGRSLLDSLEDCDLTEEEMAEARRLAEAEPLGDEQRAAYLKSQKSSARSAHGPPSISNANSGSRFLAGHGITEVEMADARRLAEEESSVAGAYKWDNDEFVDMMGEGSKFWKMREKRKAKNAKKKAKKEKAKKEAWDAAMARPPIGWTEEAPKTETFHKFMNLEAVLRKKIMGLMLVVSEDLVPYHYHEGKIMKNHNGTAGGLRKKPEVNLLVALCSKRGTKGRLILDDAQNILFRDNRFCFRDPRELIVFLDAVGSDNIMRMQFGYNLVVTRTFFSTKYQHNIELKWLARWVTELKIHMWGKEVITPAWYPEEVDDDYVPPIIETQLKIMVQVMKEASEMETLLSASPKERTPMRIKSLDLGEAFSRVADRIQTMDLAAKEDSHANDDPDGDSEAKVDKGKGRANTPETVINVNALSSEVKVNKGKERAHTPEFEYHDDELAPRLGDWYLDGPLMDTKWDGTFIDDDGMSEDSGWYPDSVIDEYIEKDPYPDRVLDDGDYTWSDDEMERRLAEIAEKCERERLGAGPSK